MPIPQNITRQDITKATSDLDVQGIPKVNQSTRYDLSFRNRRYPPKYTISKANRYANDVEFPLAEFSGGSEANNFLIARGFTICTKAGKAINVEPVLEDDESSFPEGKAQFRRHKRYERDARIVRKAKEKRLRETRTLECDACGFCFQTAYGARGVGFIEAHHNVAISKLGASHRTKVSDIALVCSNCHRMLHRAVPWLTVHQLKQVIGNPDA